ncbi:MAG: TonB-dependent receptor [Cellvibrionales bacterium]|nr:TonB-dependent receptor [Cellvibrionales bacterium]
MRNPVILLTSVLSTAFLHPTIAKTMEETVVIGTRTPQTIEKELAPVTLITKDQIDKLQINDMAQMLRQIPGMSVTRAGSYGSKVDIYLRGTATDKTLVLINGQRANSATNGGMDLSYIDPEQIERIEVVRGARTSLYGADAIGGVINIITQDETGANHAMITAGYGTYNTQRYATAARYNLSESTKIQINFTKHQSDGFDALSSKNTYKNLPQDNDNDGFDNTGIQASLSQQLGQLGRWSLGYFHNQGNNDFDAGGEPPFDPYQHRSIDTLFTKYQIALNNKWDSIINLGHFNDNSQTLDHSLASFKNCFVTNRTQALWQNDVSWNTNQMSTLGYEYTTENIDNSIPPTGGEFLDANGNPVDGRNNSAIFFQHLINTDFFELQAAVRNDDNSSYGSHTTGNLSLGIPVGPGTLIFGYGTAFRAPDFNELYYPDKDFIPNPNLKPESSRQFEIGYKGQQDNLYFELAAYLNKMEDMLTVIYSSGSSTTININKADIQGFDFIVGYQWESFWLKTNYSYVDAEDKNTHKQLVRRPKNLLTIDLMQRFEKISLGLTLLGQSQSFEWDDTKNPGFATVDFFTAYEICKGFTAKLKFANLLNQDYTLINGYNTPGITGFFSLTYDYSLQ